MRRVRSPLRGNGKIRASAFYTEKCGVSKSRISRLNADARIAYNFKEKGAIFPLFHKYNRILNVRTMMLDLLNYCRKGICPRIV